LSSVGAEYGVLVFVSVWVWFGFELRMEFVDAVGVC
jgi:hypothetical protein